MLNINESPIYWFAGLFEGEGTFAFVGKTAKAMSIEMTDEDVILKVQSLFGGAVYEVKQRNTSWKKSWRWTLTGKDSLDLAMIILPILSKRRSDRCLEYIKNITDRLLIKQGYKDRTNKILTLRDSGYSLKQIAKELNIDHGYVGKVIRNSKNVVSVAQR